MAEFKTAAADWFWQVPFLFGAHGSHCHQSPKFFRNFTPNRNRKALKRCKALKNEVLL